MNVYSFPVPLLPVTADCLYLTVLIRACSNTFQKIHLDDTGVMLFSKDLDSKLMLNKCTLQTVTDVILSSVLQTQMVMSLLWKVSGQVHVEGSLLN